MQGAGCLVVAMHQEGITSERGEEELLHRHLLHMCHLHCHAHGLATGYSRDVHGDVSQCHTLSDSATPSNGVALLLMRWILCDIVKDFIVHSPLLYR